MYPMNINIFFQLCDCFLLTYQFSKRTWFCRNKISTFINCFKFFLIFSFSTRNFRFLFSLADSTHGENILIPIVSMEATLTL